MTDHLAKGLQRINVLLSWIWLVDVVCAYRRRIVVNSL